MTHDLELKSRASYDGLVSPSREESGVSSAFRAESFPMPSTYPYTEERFIHRVITWPSTGHQHDRKNLRLLSK